MLAPAWACANRPDRQHSMSTATDDEVRRHGVRTSIDQPGAFPLAARSRRRYRPIRVNAGRPGCVPRARHQRRGPSLGCSVETSGRCDLHLAGTGPRRLSGAWPGSSTSSAGQRFPGKGSSTSAKARFARRSRGRAETWWSRRPSGRLVGFAPDLWPRRAGWRTSLQGRPRLCALCGADCAGRRGLGRRLLGRPLQPPCSVRRR